MKYKLETEDADELLMFLKGPDALSLIASFKCDLRNLLKGSQGKTDSYAYLDILDLLNRAIELHDISDEDLDRPFRGNSE